MRSARKMIFPDGFFTPERNFDWLFHHYLVLANRDYKIYTSFDNFIHDYLNPHTLVVQGSGIVIRILGIDSGHYGQVHGFIYDKCAFGQLGKLKELGNSILYSFGLYRLECLVPVQLRGVNRLLEKIGFGKEATCRYKGKRGTLIYDTNLYSITI